MVLLLEPAVVRRESGAWLLLDACAEHMDFRYELHLIFVDWL
jgi:hypothetical protein